MIRLTFSFICISLYCKDLLRSAKDETKIKELNSLCKRIEDKATSYGYQLERTTSSHKARNKNVVTKSFHKAGLVVMLDENDVGYRELPSSDSKGLEIYLFYALIHEI